MKYGFNYKPLAIELLSVFEVEVVFIEYVFTTLFYNFSIKAWG